MIIITHEPRKHALTHVCNKHTKHTHLHPLNTPQYIHIIIIN